MDKFVSAANRVAGIVTVVMAMVLPPLGYFILGYNRMATEMETRAAIKAEIVSQVAARAPETWIFEDHRLQELLARHSQPLEDEWSRILDARNNLVAEAGERPAPPVLSRAAMVFDAGQPVGRLEIERSLGTLWRNTGIAALFGFLLGMAAFITLRFIPVREIRLYAEKLQQQANHDALTGLPNRMFLYAHLRQLMDNAKRDGRTLAVGFVDLDQFKPINDSHGHNVGDELLKIVAGRLKACLRGSADIMARVGGDEFVLILYDPLDQQIVSGVANRILDSLSQPIFNEGREFRLTACIGFSLYPHDGQNIETLLKNADTAMYRAKKQGPNNFQFCAAE